MMLRLLHPNNYLLYMLSSAGRHFIVGLSALSEPNAPLSSRLTLSFIINGMKDFSWTVTE